MRGTRVDQGGLATRHHTAGKIRQALPGRSAVRLPLAGRFSLLIMQAWWSPPNRSSSNNAGNHTQGMWLYVPRALRGITARVHTHTHTHALRVEILTGAKRQEVA